MIKKIKNFRDKRSNQMQKQAADWITMVHDEKATVQDHMELDQWLLKNPEHKKEMEILSNLWDRYDDFKDHPLVINEMAESETPVRKAKFIQWLDNLFSGDFIPKPVAVAFTIVITITVMWLIQGNILSPSVDSVTYYTLTGEQKKVILPDGSTVMIDTDTTIHTNFSKGNRRIDLVSGRCLFSVIHDASNPFYVTAGRTEVRVLGTEFNIHRKKQGQVVVAVIKGSVRVKRKAKKSKPQQVHNALNKSKLKEQSIRKSIPIKPDQENFTLEKTLTPGQEVIVDNVKPEFNLHEADIERINAWRFGIIDFDKASLEDVLTEVNRYLNRKIIIGDDQLKDIRISMVFKVENSKYFLETLIKTFPITVKSVPTGEFILQKKSG